MLGVYIGVNVGVRLEGFSASCALGQGCTGPRKNWNKGSILSKRFEVQGVTLMAEFGVFHPFTWLRA